MRDTFFQGFCDKVFSADNHIRFVGLASRGGKMLGASYAKGIQNTEYLTDSEIEDSLAPLVIQVQMYHKIREIAGRLKYHIGTFEKLYTAAIPVGFETKDEFYIIMSFEMGCNPTRIIEDQIIPLLQENKDYLT